MKNSFFAVLPSLVILILVSTGSIVKAGAIAGPQGLPFYTIKVVPAPPAEGSAPAEAPAGPSFTGSSTMGIPGLGRAQGADISSVEMQQSDSIYDFAVDPAKKEAPQTCTLNEGGPGERPQWTEMEVVYVPDDMDDTVGTPSSSPQRFNTPYIPSNYTPSSNNFNGGGGGGGDVPKVVPEPISIAIFGIGMCGLFVRRRFRK